MPTSILTCLTGNCVTCKSWGARSSRACFRYLPGTDMRNLLLNRSVGLIRKEKCNRRRRIVAWQIRTSWGRQNYCTAKDAKARKGRKKDFSGKELYPLSTRGLGYSRFLSLKKRAPKWFGAP